MIADFHVESLPASLTIESTGTSDMLDVVAIYRYLGIRPYRHLYTSMASFNSMHSEMFINNALSLPSSGADQNYCSYSSTNIAELFECLLWLIGATVQQVHMYSADPRQGLLL